MLVMFLPLVTPLAPSQRAILGIGRGIRYNPLPSAPFLYFHLYFLKFLYPTPIERLLVRVYIIYTLHT